MHWFVNDVSLRGQYPDAATFAKALVELLKVRETTPILAEKLLCSRNLHTRLVTPHLDFRSAVTSVPKQIPVQLVLRWLTKHGPFWDDIRESAEDDYFEYDELDVTDSGLGEAARALLAERDAECFSFPNGSFDCTPIEVQHGLSESPLGLVSVPNTWDVSALRQIAQTMLPSPVNWVQMLEQAQARFSNLSISPNAVLALKKDPFSNYVVERVFFLLQTLQDFIDCLNEDGTHSARNHELIETHFTGQKAWFTDESQTNKNSFREEMTFLDENNNEHVFCPWHGKIKNPQYRIHFEWPVPTGAKLRVFYIGPKITKN